MLCCWATPISLKLEPLAGEAAAWAIEGWNAKIRLSKRDDGGRLVARFGDENPFVSRSDECHLAVARY